MAIRTKSSQKDISANEWYSIIKGETYKKLLPYKNKLLVLLQFDGEEIATNQALRHANPLKIRLKVLKNLNHIGIAMQLTMTLSYGVSEKEIAWVVSPR